MLEIVAARCRVIASDTRLLLLCHLSGHEELAVSDLALRSGLSVSATSNELRGLCGAGLLHRRRSGARIHYALAPKDAGTTGFALAGLLRDAFDDPQGSTSGWECDQILHVGHWVVQGVGPGKARLLDAIYDAATGFTNVRRLQLIRALKTAGKRSGADLERELHMSGAACWRHIEKLVRRGFVRAEGRGFWVLNEKGRTPIHKGLMGLVVDCLGSGGGSGS